MENLLEIIRTDNFILISFIINIVLIVSIIIETIIILRINARYVSVMKKLGNGNNVHEMLKKYMEDVKEIKKDNTEIKAYYTKLDHDLSCSIQKIGLVRYNAFKDVGSDLSFSIALLDRNDNGVVLNGIYGSESSNIYAKPIKNKKSTYQLSEEEKYAIEIAEQNKGFITKYER